MVAARRAQCPKHCASDMWTATTAMGLRVATRPRRRGEVRERESRPARTPPPPGVQTQNPTPKTHRGCSRRQTLAAFTLIAAGSAQKSTAATPGCNIDPLPPVDVAAVLEQARYLYGSGRLDEAETTLVSAIAFVSSSLFSPGCLSGDVSTAPLTLEPASAASAAPLLKLLGDIRVDAFRYDDAIAAYDAAIEAGGAEASGGAFFGRANASEGKALVAEREGDRATADGLYGRAVDDYTRCLQMNPPASGTNASGTVSSTASNSTAVVAFERAQARRALRQWTDAKADYETASRFFLAGKDKKRADIAAAQGAFAAFEAGDTSYTIKVLETLARRLYSSDVRAALAAAYWREGDGISRAKAENAWLDLCELRDAKCGKYTDTKWLVEYRKWTPALAEAMQDFLMMR